MQKAFGKLPAWRSSGDPNAQPRFRITLDSPTREKYTSGDQISGKVILQSKDDEAVKQVTIQFHGRANIIVYRKDGAHGTNTRYPGKTQLFDFTQGLYESHYTLRANTTYEWPFEFEFPSSSQTLPSLTNWEPHPSFVTKPTRMLPASYSNQYRTGLGGEGYDCAVEYKLTATLTRPGAPSAFKPVDDRGYTFDLSLPYFPLSSSKGKDATLIPVVQRHPIEFRSLLLLPENADRSLSLKEKTKAKLRSGSLPTAAFEMTVEASKSIYLGDTFALTVSVKHLPEQSSAPICPIVSLESLDIAILASTHVRCEKRVVSHERISTRSLPCTVAPLSQGQNFSETLGPEYLGPFTKATDNTQTFLVNTPTTSPYLVPSFVTPNINHTNRLCASMQLTCSADPKAAISAVVEVEILVLPPSPLQDTNGAGIGSSAGPSRAHVSGGDEDGDMLPTYQAAVSATSASPAYEERSGFPSVAASTAAAGVEVGAREVVYA